MEGQERKTLLLQIAAITLGIIVFLYTFLPAIFEDIDRLETTDITYSDYKAAVKAYEVKRGWMPAYIPTSAKDIHARHNLDTNILWWSFYYDQKDSNFMVETCVSAKKDDLIFTRKIQAFTWWPEELVEGLKEFNSTDVVYDYYTCEKTGNLAIDIDKNKAYFWDFNRRE